MINIVIDIGNTSAKLAAFQDDEILEVVTTDNSTLEDLPAFVCKYTPSRAILSTVIDLTLQVESSLKVLSCPLLRLCAEVPLPVQILYDTPHTLGSDRIAAVVGAVTAMPHKPLLVIDAGTCITYEYVDAQGRYLGGNISPGVQMRFQAMHHLTGRLPLVSSEGRSLQMGKDTETAMRAGVMQGIKYEIEGYVSNLKAKNPELLVFLTGGSDFSFDSNLKNLIFADKFLVLKGLNRILNYNK